MQKPKVLSLNSGTTSLEQGRGATWLMQQACQSGNNRIFKGLGHAQAHSAIMLLGPSTLTMHGPISFATIKPIRLKQTQPFLLAQGMLPHAMAW
jgi:hypothetical protein